MSMQNVALLSFMLMVASMGFYQEFQVRHGLQAESHEGCMKTHQVMCNMSFGKDFGRGPERSAYSLNAQKLAVSSHIQTNRSPKQRLLHCAGQPDKQAAWIIFRKLPKTKSLLLSKTPWTHSRRNTYRGKGPSRLKEYPRPSDYPFISIL